MIPNPDYKGVWKPPKIPNPDYKGPWSPRRIAVRYDTEPRFCFGKLFVEMFYTIVVALSFVCDVHVH